MSSDGTAPPGNRSSVEYRSLGRTGVQVSTLTLGSMLLHEIADEVEAGRLLDQALDQGINAVDTANVYGRGERGAARPPLEP